MSNFAIVPNSLLATTVEAENAADAMETFALEMDMDMTAYFKAVAEEKDTDCAVDLVCDFIKNNMFTDEQVCKLYAAITAKINESGKRTEFRLIFKENDKELPNWRITLKTTEPKTEDEITSLVAYWDEVNSRNAEDYSPVDVLDDLCEDKGWSWEDTDYQELEFAI